MRKIKYIIIFILTILSCTNNDEPETTRKCLANDTLLNTLWIGNGDRYGEIITLNNGTCQLRPELQKAYNKHFN